MTTPGISEPDDGQLQREILKAYQLKAYQIGIGPVPRLVRIRWKLTGPFLRLWYRITGALGQHP